MIGRTSRRFVWDQVKAESNFAKHGLKFESALDVFLDPSNADFDATHVGDGESRRKTVGLMSGRLVTVVYTLRGDAVRVISARPSNAKEKRRYADG